MDISSSINNEVAKIEPFQVVDLSVKAIGAGRALSRPLIDEGGLLVTGTEDYDSVQAVIIADHDEYGRLSDCLTFPLPTGTGVGDCAWLPNHTALFAVGKKFALLKVDYENLRESQLDVLDHSVVHLDEIREIDVSDQDYLVLSGGHDNAVHISDFSRVQATSIVRLHGSIDAEDVVSSVSWHPTDAHLASWTTDGGMLHIYDQRTSNVALRYESVYEGLFSHQFLDANLCVLGYDRGWMEVYDIRKNVSVLHIEDPAMTAIGHVQTYSSEALSFLVYGKPGVSLWQLDWTTSTELESKIEFHNCPARPSCGASSTDEREMFQLKTAGTLFSEGTRLALTTSFGCVFFYDLSDFSPTAADNDHLQDKEERS